MKIILFLCCLLLSLLCSVESSAAGRSVIHLKNGDRITGVVHMPHETQRKTETITVMTEYGTIEIPRNKLAGISTSSGRKHYNDSAPDAETLLVRKEDKTVFQAKGYRPEANSQEKKEADEPPATSKAGQDESPEKAGLWGALWSGNVNLGGNLRTGNSETNGINADASAKARWTKHRAEIKGDYNRQEEEGNITVDDRSLSLAHDYFYSEKWFVASSAGAEQDEIDLLDYRLTLASGLGYQAYERDDLNLQFTLGPGYQLEEFEDGSDDKKVIAKWSADYDQKFYDDFFRLFHEHDITTPFDDFDSFLFQSSSGIRIPVKQGVVASGRVDFDCDNAPAEGVREEDTIYSFTVGYEW